MKQKKLNKEFYVRTRVDKILKEKYVAHCKKNRYVAAKRIRALMEKDLRGEIE